MSFKNPEAFFLLIAVALFILVAVYNLKKKKSLLRGFISTAAYKVLGVRSGGEIDFFKTSLVTGSLILFIFAAAGPQWGTQFSAVDIKGVEMVFLLDTSMSMNAEDLKPNRLTVAKELINTIVDNLKTDYVSLVNFAGVAYVQCPLTVDYSAFKLMTDASMISPGEEQGTDFYHAFQVALRTFKSKDKGRKIMILITDGEDQEKQWQNFIPELQKQGIIVFTVGIGLPSPQPIPVKDKDGNITGWKKDKEGNIVKTKLDENTLIQVASHTGGQYFLLSEPAGIEVFIANLKTFERTVLNQKVKLKKINRFQYPLIIGIILLLLEFFLSEQKLQWKRKEKK